MCLEGNNSMKKQISVAMTALALAIMLAACGGNDSGTNKAPANTPANTESSAGADNAAGGQQLTIEATNFEFDKDEYIVKQGEPVTITLKSVKGNHGISINNTDINLKRNESVEYTFDAPGEYQIVCNIPCGNGHAKMVSKVVVQ